ncbi:MAG: helix-turn-helix transcriptional regulator [Firmicutes bacterium]|nr:helix-turn-helix transcriptional regulator [Bacillota bacterium]
MDPGQLTFHIREMLRRLRKERGWSLEQLAEATGVSKPMLGQIERGLSNPIVITLWKIAGGLGVPFSTFFEMPESSLRVVHRDEQPVVLDDEGRISVRNVLSIRTPHVVELFCVTLLPMGEHRAQTHGQHVTEGIWVLQGALTLQLGEQSYVLEEGDAVSFEAAHAHPYSNTTKSPCTYLNLLSYSQG